MYFLQLPLKQLDGNDDESIQSITIDTTVENLQQYVGFYYCYYENKTRTETESREMSDEELTQLFDNNKASRIYVYIESGFIKKEK